MGGEGMTEFDIKVIDQLVTEEGTGEEKEAWLKIRRHIKDKPKSCGNCKNSYKNPKGFDFCRLDVDLNVKCVQNNYSEWEVRE
jgi:hypothetical protein